MLAICILHSGYLFELTQVGQSPAFFCGEDGLAEARWSTTLEGIPTTTNILEENTRSSIELINNWDYIIKINRIRGHVYILNINQSGYTGRNTSHKQDIRVCNHREMVTFLNQNLSRSFSVYSTVINNGS